MGEGGCSEAEGDQFIESAVRKGREGVERDQGRRGQGSGLGD